MMSCRSLVPSAGSAVRGARSNKVALADDLRIEHRRRRVERVHGRVDAELGDRAREDGGCVECANAVAGAGSVRSSAGT